MKHKKITLLPLLAMIALFSACGHSGTASTDTAAPEQAAAESSAAEGKTETGEARIASGTRIQREIDEYVHIDAEVTVPDSLADLRMAKVKAHRPEIAEETVKELFADALTVKERVVDPDYKSREFGDYDIILFYGTDGEVLSYEPANVFFVGPESDAIANCLNTDPDFDSYNLDTFSLTDELPFAGREDVFRKLKGWYDALGVPVSEDYEAYALSHALLAQEENPIDSDGNVLEEQKKDAWTEEDDAYYFLFHQEVDGVPVRQVQYGDGYVGTGVEQTDLSAVYGASGLISFREEWGYVLEETDEELSIMDLEDALACLEKKCGMLVSTQDWEVDTIRLDLMPVFIEDNEYEIHPVWTFEGTIIGKENYTADLEIWFDAVTGKEITS